ncbi:hypothetical protein M011DRAFT_480334 [Sporormia fimetaria CBS 119925]|uniref:Opioid growth factor receptor (OGFr) conserved domain-containing protein n=1 Tax=Sporormia fimetaria CBS 119925 TaxID=1340428 RepID=A0A6A6V297_9PLEO|nr:hypothetical protein M011DRAFT_480334 [Sporormia fimetaria CBS 119925]
MPPKKGTAKKGTPKKVTPKKAAPKKVAPKKATPKKTTHKEPTPQEPTPEPTSKEPTPEETTLKKAAPKKTTSKKAAPTKAPLRRLLPKPKEATPEASPPTETAPTGPAPFSQTPIGNEDGSRDVAIPEASTKEVGTKDSKKATPKEKSPTEAASTSETPICNGFTRPIHESTRKHVTPEPTKSPTHPPSSPIITFYSPEAPPMARHYSKYLPLGDAALESAHNFIQYLFPLPEPSSIVADAPVIDAEVIDAFHEREDLRKNLKAAFERMLEFLGFGKVEEITIVPSCIMGDREEILKTMKKEGGMGEEDVEMAEPSDGEEPEKDTKADTTPIGSNKRGKGARNSKGKWVKKDEQDKNGVETAVVSDIKKPTKNTSKTPQTPPAPPNTPSRRLTRSSTRSQTQLPQSYPTPTPKGPKRHRPPEPSTPNKRHKAESKIRYTHGTPRHTIVIRTLPSAEKLRTRFPADSHNYKRITRILRCLRLLGLPDEAEAFYSALVGLYQQEKTTISATAMRYWTGATREPLWKIPGGGEDVNPEGGEEETREVSEEEVEKYLERVREWADEKGLKYGGEEKKKGGEEVGVMVKEES